MHSGMRLHDCDLGYIFEVLKQVHASYITKRPGAAEGLARRFCQRTLQSPCIFCNPTLGMLTLYESHSSVWVPRSCCGVQQCCQSTMHCKPS